MSSGDHVSKDQLGDCYAAANRFCLTRSRDENAPVYEVVHGEVAGQGDLQGTRFGHAWVEHDEVVGDHTVRMVTDRSNRKDVTLPADFYYQLGEIDPDTVKRYSVEDVARYSARSGHHGPWDE